MNENSAARKRFQVTELRSEPRQKGGGQKEAPTRLSGPWGQVRGSRVTEHRIRKIVPSSLHRKRFTRRPAKKWHTLSSIERKAAPNAAEHIRYGALLQTGTRVFLSQITVFGVWEKVQRKTAQKRTISPPIAAILAVFLLVSYPQLLIDFLRGARIRISIMEYIASSQLRVAGPKCGSCSKLLSDG